MTDTPTEEQVKRVAKDMWASKGIRVGDHRDFDQADSFVQDHWRGLARDAIAAMPSPTVWEAARVLLNEHYRCSAIIPSARSRRENSAAHLGRKRLWALTQTPQEGE